MNAPILSRNVPLADLRGPKTVEVTATPEQRAALAKECDLLDVSHLTAMVTLTPEADGAVRPGGIVESLQPLDFPGHYPQWKTIANDLVLFGSTADNVLLLDQARAAVLPPNSRADEPGMATVAYVRSPFVGECDVIDIITPDAAGIRAAVQTLIRR